MKRYQLTMALALFAASAVVQSAVAGSLTYNFDQSKDYLLNGVGGSIWDGVYLKGGDVPGSTGNGTTIGANETAFAGYLQVQTQFGGWSGGQNDGFFLYKMVSGDFDVSVLVAQPFANVPFTFSGLLVRAAETSGAPLGGSEDWLGLTRFQEFSLGEGVRFATNGVDNEFYYTAGDNNDLASNRYLRIARVGDVFNFYNKTNTADAWHFITNVTRVDLAGMPMQVGIQQATFTDGTPLNYFGDFNLTAANVGLGTPPDAPTALSSTLAGGGSRTVTWTPAAGSDGSVVLIRANGTINHKPADGFVYTGDLNFATAPLLGGSGVKVAYVGSGNSATITGLGGDNNNYSVAVFSFKGTGASTVYGAPAATTFTGPGTLTSVSFSINPTTIPIGGIAVATLTATYSTGDSYDVSASPETSWTSTDPTIVNASAGVLMGMVAGSTQVSATYRGITGQKTVTVAPAAFTDNFSVTQDLVTNGVAGSKWDGVYLGSGSYPGSSGGGRVTVASINGVTNNSLVVTANDTSWVGAENDGFLLFKKVTGDFQAAVRIAYLQKTGDQFAGLMARAAETNGAPLGGSEDWVFFGQYGKWNFSTIARGAVNGVDDQLATADGDTVNNYWLLMQRVGNTFRYFQRLNATDPWTPRPEYTMERPDLAGLPLQVGIFESMYAAANGTVVFESFMLNSTNIAAVATTPAAPTGLNFSAIGATTMNINWTKGTGSTGTVVVVRAGAPVNVQPINGVVYTGNAAFGSGYNLGSGNYVVYAGTGSSVTVTGLTPGTQYYAAIFSYGGTTGAWTYNQTGALVSNVKVGQLEGIVVNVPSRIPTGGIGRASVLAQYTGGYAGPVTTGFTLTSGDTNILKIYPNSTVLSGMAPGTATLTTIFTEGSVSMTNVTSVNIAEPTMRETFSTPRNFLTQGVAGSVWDGFYAPGVSPIPGSTYTGDPSAAVSVADASISSNNTLTVTSVYTGWEGAQNNGFFLFKNVPADFQMAVHLGPTLLNITDTATNVVAPYNNPGLLARGYTNNGAPFVGGTNETWLSFTRFDEFNIGTYVRRTRNNGTQQRGQTGYADGEYWLLMVRQNSTNFTFYQKKEATDPWRVCPNGTFYNMPEFEGRPMQVGMLAGPFNSGNSATAQFDNFMLDIVIPAPRLQVTTSSGNIVVGWPDGKGTLQSSPSLSAPDWQAVSLTRTTNNGVISVTIPTAGSASFFRLIE